MAEIQTPFEHTAEPDHGSFPWNEGVTDDIYAEDRYGFREWLFACGVEDHIVELLHDQKYLTEGDMARLMRFDSQLSNPFRFFCGDAKVYYKTIDKLIKDRNAEINIIKLDSDKKMILAFLIEQTRLLQEALDDCPILPEEKDALRQTD